MAQIIYTESLAFTYSNSAKLETTVTPSSGSSLTPTQNGWIFAGSAAVATKNATLGLVTDGSLPTVDSSGTITLWHVYNPEYGYNLYTYNTSLYPAGSYSMPNQLTGYSTNVEGQNSSGSNSGFGGDPIRYSDGAVDYSTKDLTSDVLGNSLAQSRSWTNYTAWSSTQNNGNGWIDSSLPTISQVTGDKIVNVVFSGINAIEYELSGGIYVPTTYVADTLVHDTTNHQFVLTDTKGNQYKFYDFSSSVSTNLKGQFISLSEASGTLTSVTARTTTGEAERICRYNALGQAVGSLFYTYLSGSDPNAGLISSVQLQISDGNGGWTTVKQASYSYYQGTYTGSDTYGNLGDLKTATITDANGAILDIEYYRYYTPTDCKDTSGNTIGYKHGLKYVFDEASYANLLASLSASALTSDAAFSATDAQVARYANLYYQYDAQRRVTLQTVQGVGGAATNGLGTFTFAYYMRDTFSGDTNTWMFKTVETTPDGSVNVVYCNTYGEVILKVAYEDSSLADQVTAVYNQYDSVGQRTLEADSSAIDSFSLNGNNNLIVTLKASSGTIHEYEYYTTTTATSTTAGGVKGYFHQSTVQQGTSGTALLLENVTYYARTADGVTAYNVAADTIYADGTTSTAETASYSYTWYSGTIHVATLIETLPTGVETKYVYDSLGRTTAIISNYVDGIYSSSSPTEDIKTAYTYDTLGRITKTVEHYVDGIVDSNAPTEDVTTIYAYDNLGHVTQMTDAQGNVTFFVYDNADREIRTYKGWRLNTITGLYYAATNAAVIVNREDLFGNYTETLSYVWTGDGANALPVNADGSPTGGESLTSSYASLQSLTRSLMNSSGKVVAVLEYFNLSGLAYSTSRTLGTKNVNYYETDKAYGTWGDLASVTDALGNTTAYTYDFLGNVVSVTDALNGVTTYEYDSNSRLVAVTDALGVTTRYEYNYLGRMIKACQNYVNGVHEATDAADQDVITSYTYNVLGNLLTVTNALGNTTAYAYDSLGEVTSVTDPLDNETSYAYDAVGNRISVTDALNNTTHYVYDAMGEVTSVTDALNHATAYAYDAFGNLVSTTDANGNTTTYAYNAVGQLISKTDALDNTTTYTYDAVGNLMGVTDALNHTTTYAYNSLGKLTSTTDANGDTTTYTYNALGKLLTLTDAEDNTTTYTYDDLGRVLTETNELNAAKSYVYDVLGELVRYTDRDGRVTTYTYDHLGRKTAENWLDGNSNIIATTSYTYDVVGDMLTAVNSEVSYTYTYDDLGRIASETQVFDDLTPTIVLSYQYDDVGNVAQVAATIGGTADYVTDYTYDAANRVTSIRQHGVTGGNAVAEKRIDFTYDDVGQYATITTYANLAGTQLVSTATHAFDDAYELVGLTYTKGATTLASYAYTYDDAGNMTGMTTVDGTNAYTNDATGQLTTTDSSYTDDEAYAYDDNGNRVTANGNTYTTGDDNQLRSDGTYRYTYDAEGNRTSKFVDTDADGVLDAGDTNVTTYTWDYRNRLTEVDHFSTYANYAAGTSDQSVDYAYDAFNRLVDRTLDADGTTGTGDIAQTVYVYDGDQVALQFDAVSPLPLGEGQGEGIALSASDLSHRYLWNSQAVDHLFADEQLSPLPPGEGQGEGSAGYDLTTPGRVLWALTDHENSVRDLATYDSGTDVTTIANHRVYDSFGKLKSETNSAVDCLFGYTGRQLDEASGLQNNLNRWYDAKVGRWMSEDPIGFMAGDANLYRYVGNNALSHIDPSGLDWLDDASNFFAGFGDTVTMGLTERYRQAIGANQFIDKNSGLYQGGQVAGEINNVALSVANPCGAGRWAGRGIRMINGVQAVGNGVNAVDNVVKGCYERAGWDALGALGNVSQMSRTCFAAGTPLLTPNGSKPIEQFKVGDLVLSAPEDDPDALPMPRRVEEVFERVCRVLELRVDGQTIRTTHEHPFYVEGKGWTQACALLPGDLLKSHDGRTFAVESLTDTSDDVTVYNMRIEEYHTYFVGDTAWGFSVWAHNANCGGESAAAAKGRQAHKDYVPGPGYEKEVTLPSGKRADAINWETRDVRELKPNNPNAIRRGQRQVEGYRNELEGMTDEDWTSGVDTY